MPNRNVDKGREAENATARVLVEAGMPHAERRTKRGGRTLLECPDCTASAYAPGDCARCNGLRLLDVPADAGDITGVPGLVVQVKWSQYGPLTKDLQRTDEQRRVARADIGLLVVKRPGVGLARAGEWDAYLPSHQVAWLMAQAVGTQASALLGAQMVPNPEAPWRTDLLTAAHLISHAGYGDPATKRWTAADYAACLS